ncbi:replication restart DNA helicase PriA [Andreprevotia lacus DSM 23236]|jgi:primosomal protein N' (replication factor Y)|uniref:Replication restart protein PriA n=1 Tax=Andreprevotia lacus DSM 23236 TaxID=1121001 RepID=A0A1W1X0R3_9NEIS|nr:primosomal protein N' [Andreprevotia lacus]SMC16971.1 replication restart DNA helicase PriA [Andreprevotia lacus DSM 23236]
MTDHAADFYAAVALDVPLARSFDYRVAGVLPAVGERVVVPFGRQRLSGVVTALSQIAPDFAGIRDIESAPGDMPALPADVLALCRFVADYYLAPIGQVLAGALPTVFRQPKVWSGFEAELAYAAPDVEALLATLSARARKQRALAEALRQPRRIDELRAVASDASRWLKDWQAAGQVITRPWQPPAPGQVHTGPRPELQAEQAAAVDALGAAQGFVPWLLYGITGSGKTEVYLRSIEAVLQRGQQALVLVPEINLTPQLEGRFRQRFPEECVVSLHSGLAEGERTRNWLMAARGEARIVLGTRLAVFAPLPALGLIVVDEEHDPSYRQSEGVRYSARDLAVYRANQRKVPVLLGSATPSLESWKNAREGRYRLLQLKQRAVTGAVAPKIELLPTGRVYMPDGIHPLALDALARTLNSGGQALVFINRRGYAPVLSCRDCGWISGCKRCSAKLVLHLSERRLRCHHCGYEIMPPVACPDCGNQDLQPLGQGTQRIEDILASRFPETPPLRIDRDNTRRKGSLEAMLAQVHAGEARLLVGTQMLAKGHDFAKLQLVLVLGADSGLFSVDFRAEERLYAQLLQVAGRAGRAGQPGRVLIQTHYPEHPFFGALVRGDYAAFADEQLAQRKQLLLPPASHWAMLRAEARQMPRAMGVLKAAQADLRAAGITVNDPVPATLVRKAGVERAQLVLSAPQRGVLQQALDHWLHSAQIPSGVRVTTDIDPQEF